MELPLKPRPRGARWSAAHSASAERIPETHGYYKSADGLDLFFTPPKGPAIHWCFVTALVCSSLHWTYQIEHFRKSHQAVWFDYRGHHNSQVPTDLSTITIERFADDLKRLFDHLRIDRATLVGHSMGVSVALEFAHRNPDRVKSLVLSNGAAQRPLETLLHNFNLIPMGFEMLCRLYEASPSLFKRGWDLQKGSPLARLIVRLAGFNPHLAAVQDVNDYVSQVEEMDPGIFLQVLRNYHAHDATAWLHTIEAPRSGPVRRRGPGHSAEAAGNPSRASCPTPSFPGSITGATARRWTCRMSYPSELRNFSETGARA
jgi:pimeloyl-ACP methyl ester carboxylesterase